MEGRKREGYVREDLDRRRRHTFGPGGAVVVLPGGQRSRITSVETFDGPLDEAPASLSVTVRVDDELDVSRGDLVAPAETAPEAVRPRCAGSPKHPSKRGDGSESCTSLDSPPAQTLPVLSRLDVGR